MYLRVDDRLVHGQVVTAWLKQLKVKRLLVVDDTAAKNRIIAKALKMATPSGVSLEVASVEEGKALVASCGNQSLIIVKTPMAARALVMANPEHSWEVCVGNVGAAPGRKTYAGTVHLDEENYAAIKDLLGCDDVDVFMQTVPGQPVNHF